ncbi:hypothetical protein D12LOC_02809 [Dickeya solani]|nr:hypothetical protein [Dickeya solani]
MAVEGALVIAEQYRQPAAVLVVEVFHHLRQLMQFDGEGQLIGGLPFLFQNRRRKLLSDMGDIIST